MKNRTTEADCAMEMIRRDCCVLTGSVDLEPLYCFEKFPVFVGCVNTPPEEDMVADMAWHISRGSGIIQLNPLLPLDILYPVSHGAGSIGKLWESYHHAFAEFIHKYTPSSVLEIGGSHGILARNYQLIQDIPWTIVEPNPAPVEGCRAKFLLCFFDDSFVFDGQADTIVHSQVFEHMYEPDKFVQHLSGFMQQGQKLIFAVPNMKEMLGRKYTNCLNFEHTVFLTDPYVEYLLAKWGFQVVEKRFFLDDHSIFYSTVRNSSVKHLEMPSVFSENKMLFVDFVTYHKALVNSLNVHIAEAASPCYLFGAHIFSQYLIAFGLDASRFVCILDNDKNKQGKRLSGTHLMVQSPKILENVSSPIVVLKAGFYNQEIRQDILENINADTQFLE